MSHEIVEDPGDIFIRLVGSLLEELSLSTGTFIAFYLMFWGGTDVFLSSNTLRHKLWAFPISLTLIGAFVLYEIYRVTHTHSLVLAFIILLDLAILWLINREYRILKGNYREGK